MISIVVGDALSGNSTTMVIATSTDAGGASETSSASETATAEASSTGRSSGGAKASSTAAKTGSSSESTGAATNPTSAAPTNHVGGLLQWVAILFFGTEVIVNLL